jgi:type IV pilus assembly protein PilY1
MIAPRFRLVRTGIIGSIALAALGVAGDSSAQAVKKPNVMIVVDTSESMVRAFDGTSADCDASDKGRWAVLLEALTGSIDDLECDSGNTTTPAVPVQSNDCRPMLNRRSEVVTNLAAVPGSWPYATSFNPETRPVVVFCGKNADYDECFPDNSASAAGLDYIDTGGELGDFNGEVCTIGNNRWDQTDDGLIDAYSSTLRFGVTGMDSLANTRAYAAAGYQWVPINRVAGDANYGGPNDCQLMTDGSHCAVGAYTDSEWQFSYWFSNVAGEHWLNGPAWPRTSFTRNIVTETLAGAEFTTSEARIDVGVRNPHAHPHIGRMIGFGAPSWDFTQAVALNCASEDSCTIAHNEMVQQALLGTSETLARVAHPAASVHSSTPLAASLRDTYQFYLYDTLTEAVHVPHRDTTNPNLWSGLKGKIGPSLDPFFTNAVNSCRQNNIVIVTSGRPTDDIDERAGYWADRLINDAGVRTFVVALAAKNVTWNPVANAPSNATAINADCSALDPPSSAFFDPGSGTMCEEHPTLPHRFKYAEAPYVDAASGAQRDRIQACCTVLEMAYEGGTVEPYFSESAGEVKQDLNQIFNKISGTLISRTQPVFVQAPQVFIANGGNGATVKGTYFEIRSSTKIAASDTMWRGNLERVRYACSALDVPTPQTVTTNYGDRYQENVNLDPNVGPSRRFFTVVPTVDATDETMIGSLRLGDSTTNNHDGLFVGGAGSKYGNYTRFGNNPSTDPWDETVRDFEIYNEFSSCAPGSDDLEDALGLTAGDTGTCNIVVDDPHLNHCAENVIRWYAGDDDPDDNTPSRVANSSECPAGQTCSALGGIYRSNPIVVPPPEPSDSDDQNFGRTRSNGTTSFFQDYMSRPTVIYQQTTDGQLHAFNLTMNDFDGGTNPDWDSSASPMPVQMTNSLRNNELWTFIPPIVIPSLFPNFNSQVRLLDGQMAWGNVIYDRPYGTNAGVSSTTTTDWDYATVIVGASGESAIGGFYYALDVTDPLKPRFLWQLSYAGNGDSTGDPGDRLFGRSAPGAAITHVRYLEKDGKTKILAAAILPGGDSYTPAGGAVTTREIDPATYWTPTARRPRNWIRDWGNSSEPSRSLTVVELATGRILGRITGSMADNPRRVSDPLNLANTELDSYVIPPEFPFDSPISGIPVAYPAGTGEVADRIYVGDADGTMWRVDLSSPDSDNWRARIAFDGYNRGASDSTLSDAYIAVGPNAGTLLSHGATAGQAAIMGQPIQTSPVLSFDESGNVVVTFSTGDQEEFSTMSTGMVNVVASFADVPITTYPGFIGTIDANTGVELAFEDGARHTGPLNLFDGQLYFAFFNPSSGAGCVGGKSGLCGYNYIKKATGIPIPSTDLNSSGSVTNADICSQFAGNEVVFGVSINLLPSCVPVEAPFDDPWLAGQYKSITQSNIGRYQLSFHTGRPGHHAQQRGHAERSPRPAASEVEDPRADLG